MRRFGLMVLLSLLPVAVNAGPPAPLDACELKTGDAQIAACTRFIETQGEDKQGLAIAYRNRGKAHDEAQHYDQAVADLSQAVTLDPRSTAAHFYRAMALSSADRNVEAIPDYDALLAADPKDPYKPDEADTLCRRGLAYLKKGGEDARGFADIDRAIALKPADLYCYIKKADAFHDRGNVEQEIAALDQIISVMPNDPKVYDVYYRRGEVHLKRGDNDKAIADYTRASEVDPTQTQGLFARAILFERLGRVDLAIADYDKLLILNPKHEFYAKRRAELKKTKDGAPAK